MEFLVTIFTNFLSNVLSLIAKWKWFSGTVYKPDVFVSRINREHSLYAQIHNTGNEPLSELKIEITWSNKGAPSTRHLTGFFNDGENPALAISHTCEYLKLSELKGIKSLPQYSDNGVIYFKVSGRGVKSNRTLKRNFEINNQKYS